MTAFIAIIGLPIISSAATLTATALGADTPTKLLTVTFGSAAIALGFMGALA